VRLRRGARALDGLVKRPSRDGSELHLCYEAGPCGYGVHRHLTSLGHACTVVAPALIPQRPGDRVKTNRRDAEKLAKAHRAGELVAVWVPDQEHEAMRDLARAREAAVRDVRKAWSGAHRRWLARLRFEQRAQQTILQEYIEAIEAAEQRRDRLAWEIENLLPEWSMALVVLALQALRGMGLIVAVTLAAEVGDLRRFDNPRQLMAYLGLVPSEASSGDHVRRGAITKTGNGRARRALIEAAWSYRHPARVGPTLHERLEGRPSIVRSIAWKAHVRLCGRYRRLRRASKKPQVAATAIARERLGFAWAIARQVPPRTA
jgi:transposase